MGLDMYLTAKKYVGGWKHRTDPTYSELVELSGITPCEESPAFYLSAYVGYWRKANAIHRWFVKHVQNGKDDCGEYYVEREQLKRLRDECRDVLDSIETIPGQVSTGTTYHADGRVEHTTRDGVVVAQAGLAASKLPTQSGFFFGNTDYDEYYLDDLRRTVKFVDRVLSDPALEGCDFHYQSSW